MAQAKQISRIWTVAQAPHKDISAAAARKAAQDSESQRKRQFKPGTIGVREFRNYQKTTKLLLRKTLFIRLVCKIAQDIKPDFYFQMNYVRELQEESEASLVERFEDTNQFAIHALRVTIQKKGMDIAAEMIRDKEKMRFEYES